MLPTFVPSKSSSPKYHQRSPHGGGGGRGGMHPKTLLSYAFLFFGYYFILGAKDSRRRLFRALGIFSDEDLKTLSKEALQKRDSYSVWDKHFNRDEVPKEQFAVGLFLEYLEDRRLNLNRGRARALSPFFDLNNDGIVTRNEYGEFIRKFSHTNSEGGGDDKKLLKAALSEATRTIQSRKSGNNGGEGGRTGLSNRGCALHLDRKKRDYLEILESGDLQFGGTAPFTIELWVKPKRASEKAVLVSKYDRGKWGQYFVQLQRIGESDEMEVFFHREVAPWGQKAGTIPLHAFTHIACSYGNGVSSIYINGTLASSQKEAGQDQNPETPVLIGAMLEKGEPIDFYDGILDDVRIWRISRSQLDIRESMLLSLSGMETGLEAYWEFNECLGKHAKEKTGESKHDAKLHGGAWTTSSIKFKSYQESFGCKDTHC
ncbi:unnamed protein product [Bathycoccus prasinos]|jgi:hypothetical protein